jgi:hypothetical protein
MNNLPHLVKYILRYNSLHFDQIILILQLVHQFILYFIFKFEMFINYLFMKNFSHHLFILFKKFFNFVKFMVHFLYWKF